MECYLDTVELVDHHAHNILSTCEKVPLHAILSEASPQASVMQRTSLSYLRSIRDLQSLAQASDIEKFRATSSLESWAETCISSSNIASIIIDEGFGNVAEHLDIPWHQDRLQNCGGPHTKVYSVLRIEKVAEQCMKTDGGLDLDMFRSALENPAVHVIGFKTIRAYRGGFAVPTSPLVTSAEREGHPSHNPEREREWRDQGFSSAGRVTDPELLEHILHVVCEIASKKKFPIQVHCGFGDTDLSLENANPLLLKRYFERYPDVKFVLLHAAYPFTKEAGYLASVYPNVYIDFGLAIPLLSVAGMKSTLTELLHLAPYSKILFSSDSHTGPEMFYLSAKWGRKILAAVLEESIENGDLSVEEAKHAGLSILKTNCLELYRLPLHSTSNNTALNPPNKEQGRPVPSDELHLKEVSSRALPLGPRVDHSQQQMAGPAQDVKAGRDCVFVMSMWVDSVNIRRAKSTPIYLPPGTLNLTNPPSLSSNAPRHIPITPEQFPTIAISQAQMAVPMHADAPVLQSGLNAVGEVFLRPDVSTAYMTQSDCVLVMNDMIESTGQPWEYCPRQFLRRAVSALADHGYELKCGFEIEFYVISPTGDQIDNVPFASSNAPVLPLIPKIVLELAGAGIDVVSFHAEAGPGQYEIALAPRDPLRACDELTYAKDTICRLLKSTGAHVTFAPKPRSNSPGNGQHLHLSLWKDGVNITGSNDDSVVSPEMKRFMNGWLYHMRALCAMTTPSTNSYHRLKPQMWAGAFVCWGLANREASIRVVQPAPGENGIPSHIEFKPFDGTANPYFGLGAIIHAGLHGMNPRDQIRDYPPVNVDPATLTIAEMKEMGIVTLPQSCIEALQCFESDTYLKACFGENLTRCLTSVRRADIAAFTGRTCEEEASFMLSRLL